MVARSSCRIGCLLALAACVTACGNSLDEHYDAVRAQLRDPDSAQFRNEFTVWNELNEPVLCGEVNAKTAFGGYLGYRRFFSFGRYGGDSPSATIEGSDRILGPEFFEEAWQKICVELLDNRASE